MQIGEILREAREANDQSLDDIQEETKIQKRYLVAIEQDDFHALPGKFYARAFIKEYAQAVGLDPAEVLQGFDEENIQTEHEETMQYTRLERSKRPKAARGTSFLSFLPTIIVIVLVIGIIFVAWALYQKTLNTNSDVINNQPEDDEIIRNIDGDDGNPDNEEEADQEEKAEDNETEEKQDTENQQSGEFSIVETGTGSSPLSTLNFAYSDDQVEVSFEVAATSYVEIKGADDSVYFTGNMEADTDGETFNVTEEERIYFNIGNAPGITIFVNDVELEYPVDPNDRVHQKLWVNLQKSE